MTSQEASEQTFERLVIYIHSAIESEQTDGPALFNDETVLRLRLVYEQLRIALGLPAQK